MGMVVSGEEKMPRSITTFLHITTAAMPELTILRYMAVILTPTGAMSITGTMSYIIAVLTHQSHWKKLIVHIFPNIRH